MDTHTISAMTSQPAWMADPDSLTLTEAQYDALPDGVRKMIEVIDGHVILCQSGTPEHSDVSRRLANRLEAARPAQPCTRVSTDIDVYFVKRRRSDGKLSFRRPDVSIYRCIERGAKLTTQDTLMVVEVVSPGSGYTDTVDKLAEYAYEGIAVYLLIFLDKNLYVDTIREYRLDWASRTYRLAQIHEDELVLADPFSVTVTFANLDG
jgi:Uma2 family endonuclease